MNHEAAIQELSFLVVDDDDIFVGAIVGILQSMGAGKVVTARSGSDALAKLAAIQRPIDCVLCDVKMPGGNGLQLLQALRLGMAKSVRADACFILITAVADSELIKTAGQLDANGYIVKPVTREKLAMAIARGRARGFALNAPQYQAVAIPEVA